MSDSTITFQDLKRKVEKFAKDRDWEQFHSPKNLSMAMAVEIAELMEVFQWLEKEESHQVFKNKKKREEIEDEIADIAVYILEFCNICNIDLSKVINRKLKKNAKKYPVRKSKGNAHKYTEL